MSKDPSNLELAHLLQQALARRNVAIREREETDLLVQNMNEMIDSTARERDEARELAAGYLWGRVVRAMDEGLTDVDRLSILARETKQFLEPEFAEHDWLREAVRKVADTEAEMSRIVQEARGLRIHK